LTLLEQEKKSLPFRDVAAFSVRLSTQIVSQLVFSQLIIGTGNFHPPVDATAAKSTALGECSGHFTGYDPS
jgi:hypothetical protein